MPPAKTPPAPEIDQAQIDEAMAAKAQDEQSTKARELRASKPDSWIAVDPGDEITGRLAAIEEAWSEVRNDGSWYPLLSVDVTSATGYGDDVRELKVHAFRGVLYQEVMRQRPEIGDTFTITYVGTSPRIPSKGWNRPEIYRVRVHGRTAGAARIYESFARVEAETNSGDPRKVPPSMRPGATAPAPAVRDEDADIPF